MRIIKKSSNSKFFKSQTSIITLKKPSQEEKEFKDYKVSISPVNQDNSLIAETVGNYLTHRAQSFFDYLVNPLLLIVFIILSVFDYFKYKNYYLATLTLLIIIEYLIIKMFEKRLMTNLKNKELEQAMKIGEKLSVATSIYLFTALVFIFFQIRLLIVR